VFSHVTNKISAKPKPLFLPHAIPVLLQNPGEELCPVPELKESQLAKGPFSRVFLEL